jgi:GNAT superfamily N-acetyltransferase
MHPHADIREVTHSEIPEVIDFVMQARSELFPTLAASGVPDDLARFEDVYLLGEGRFLVARNEGELIACIGFLPYDHRFAQLDYQGLNVVEVVRLFVVPEHRRSGLAGRLFEALKALASEAGVEVIYLHTHPFLPGAIDFWCKRGFVVTDIEADPVWQTTHMEGRWPAESCPSLTPI